LHDLESIREYIARDSALYADLVVRRIVAGVDRLASFPESGRVVPERGDPKIREVIVKPYRIVYRRQATEVEIVTVFRASRLLPDLE
jgi:plasmid stabilization system protein ParE